MQSVFLPNMRGIWSMIMKLPSITLEADMESAMYTF